MNNGTGTFGAKVDYPVAGPGQDLAAGDFNGDGRLDVVVTINDTVRSHLAEGRTETARRLSEKPVVLLWPARLRGRVIWPLDP